MRNAKAHCGSDCVAGDIISRSDQALFTSSSSIGFSRDSEAVEVVGHTGQQRLADLGIERAAWCAVEGVIAFGIKLRVGQDTTDRRQLLRFVTSTGRLAQSFHGACRALCARISCRSISMTVSHFSQ